MSNVTEPTSVFTPDETISIPPSKIEESAPEARLSEYDHEAQKDCRRTNTILALEAEYDTFVSPEMYWGAIDEFCQHDSHTYVYKDWIKENVATDVQQRKNDGSKYNSYMSSVTSYLGYVLGGEDTLTYEAVRDILLAQPAGFPQVTLETPQFFQCEDVGQHRVSIDEVDQNFLTIVKSTFNDDVHPLMADLNGRLYFKDGKLFCTDILAFEHNPNGKLGLLINPTTSEKYDISKAYFFPFTTLTAEQEEFVKMFGKVEAEDKDVEIINL
jgi:hypothetical protein